MRKKYEKICIIISQLNFLIYLNQLIEILLRNYTTNYSKSCYDIILKLNYNIPNTKSYCSIKIIITHIVLKSEQFIFCIKQ